MTVYAEVLFRELLGELDSMTETQAEAIKFAYQVVKEMDYALVAERNRVCYSCRFLKNGVCSRWSALPGGGSFTCFDPETHGCRAWNEPALW